MSQYLDLILNRIRRMTQQESFTDSATLTSQIGLQTQTLVDLYNEGLQVLRGIVYTSAQDLYIKTDTQNITANTETYTLPTDNFLNVNVLNVEFKYGTGDNEYRKLRKAYVHDRDGEADGDPYRYTQQENTIHITPVPTTATTNGLRITYEYQLPAMDVRRGKISAVDDGDDPTSITITDTTQGDISLAGDIKGLYITVVDKYGTQQMKDIPISSYDSGTGIITLESFTSSASESIAVNDYVVMGPNTTTHSPFPDFCDSFLVDYVTAGIMEMYGHPSIGVASAKVDTHKEQLMNVFAIYNTDQEMIDRYDVDRDFQGWYY